MFGEPVFRHRAECLTTRQPEIAAPLVADRGHALDRRFDEVAMGDDNVHVDDRFGGKADDSS